MADSNKPIFYLFPIEGKIKAYSNSEWTTVDHKVGDLCYLIYNKRWYIKHNLSWILVDINTIPTEYLIEVLLHS